MHLACQRGRRAPLLPISYPTAHSRKVPPPKSRVKAKSSFSGRIYFITMHHQAGVHYENFTEVKFRDILLSGTGHRDRRLNRDSPGQTYGRSNLDQNLKPKSNFRFIREKTFAIPSFDQKCRAPPKSAAPPIRVPAPYDSASDSATLPNSKFFLKVFHHQPAVAAR